MSTIRIKINQRSADDVSKVDVRRAINIDKILRFLSLAWRWSCTAFIVWQKLPKKIEKKERKEGKGSGEESEQREGRTPPN